MTVDLHKNFAYSLVATAPSPATSGTSLVVTAADGALFPAVPFNAVIWPTALQPLSTNAEIVRVTTRSTDTLTITRAQESSSARSVIVGDQIAAAVTRKTLLDVEQQRPYLPLAPSGALAETLSRAGGTSFSGNPILTSNGTTNATLFLQAIDLPNDLTITSISFASGGTGMTSGTHQIFGLFDDSSGSSSGTARGLLRGTSDDTSTAWGSATTKTLNLTSTYTTVRAGLHYLGILVVATTPPQLLSSTVAQVGAWQSLPAPIIMGNSSTGQTALPNPAGAITVGTLLLYGWVS